MHPWRERLHRWFAPAARRCPFSPNTVTLIALLLNVIAAALLYRRMFLVAIAFITIGGLADAFDGIVAREQHKESRYGDFLDHFADRISDTLLLAGWILGNRVRVDLAVAALIIVMLNGYVGTQIEATWRERSYEGVGRGEFVLALVVFPIASHLLVTNELDAALHGGLTIAEWMTILLIAFAVLGIVQRMRLAARLERSES